MGVSLCHAAWWPTTILLLRCPQAGAAAVCPSLDPHVTGALSVVHRQLLSCSPQDLHRARNQALDRQPHLDRGRPPLLLRSCAPVSPAVFGLHSPYLPAVLLKMPIHPTKLQIHFNTGDHGGRGVSVEHTGP